MGTACAKEQSDTTQVPKSNLEKQIQNTTAIDAAPIQTSFDTYNNPDGDSMANLAAVI